MKGNLIAYANTDRKLIKRGGRNAVKISQDELFKLIHKQHNLSSDRYYQKILFADFTTEDISLGVLRENSKIDKDLSKVQFDDENNGAVNYDNDPGRPKGLIGLQTLPNGLTFLGMYAGGDWEYPVFFIIYYDGKSLRGYIPTCGNMINLDFKTAFGSEDDSEKVDIDEVMSKPPYNNCNGKFLLAYLGLLGTFQSGKDLLDLQFNWELIQEDIEGRIVVK